MSMSLAGNHPVKTVEESSDFAMYEYTVQTNEQLTLNAVSATLPDGLVILHMGILINLL